MDVKTSQHYRDWLVFSQAPGLGHRLALELLEEFKTPNNILQAEESVLLNFGLHKSIVNALHSPNRNQIDMVLNWLNGPRHHLITINDSDYPELLKNIYAAPILLYAVGRREVLQKIHFAIVGSRNPTESGKKLANDFAYELASAGLCISSGLALGIDYQSHVGALRANCPTIAVLGNGLDQIYPAKHKHLASEIIDQGILLSEYPPGVSPLPGHFPQRNRIISGLSVGVLVVEAAKKSGSLITAHFALEQAREVFAIPGSVHNPLARGTHSLIKQGAKLVETVEDILEDISPLVNLVVETNLHKDLSNQATHILEPEYAALLDSMGYDDITIDSLVKLSGLTAESVSSMLLILELQGLVESRHGGTYCRIS